MPRYIFVMNTQTQSFPERYRAVRPGEDAAALVAAEGLTGTVPEAEVEAFFDRLTDRFPPGDACVAEMAYATRWETVERSFYGLWRS